MDHSGHTARRNQDELLDEICGQMDPVMKDLLPQIS